MKMIWEHLYFTKMQSSQLRIQIFLLTLEILMILKMKEQYGFRKVVAFGDSVNDMPMFRVADEAYAVGNALEELKNIATGVIGRNEDDAVARFLETRPLPAAEA